MNRHGPGSLPIPRRMLTHMSKLGKLVNMEYPRLVFVKDDKMQLNEGDLACECLLAKYC